MRRLGTFLLVGTVLMMHLVAFGASATEGQEVHGYVLPTRVMEGCDRYLDSVLQTSTRTHLSYRFPVSRSTWGKQFTLTPDLKTADLDISFRPGLWPRHEFLRLGGETGVVPNYATEARVCLNFGSPTTFVYRAGSLR